MLAVMYGNKFWWTDDCKEKNGKNDDQAFLYGQKPTSLSISSDRDESEQEDEKDNIENSRLNASKSFEALTLKLRKKRQLNPTAREKLEKVADAYWIRVHDRAAIELTLGRGIIYPGFIFSNKSKFFIFYENEKQKIRGSHNS